MYPPPEPFRPCVGRRAWRGELSGPRLPRRGRNAPVHGVRPGPYLTDADGNRYVDLVCSWGPMILGHAHPEVIAAVQAAVAAGTSFGTPGEGEVELAEEMVAGVKPVEQVRLVSPAPRRRCRPSGWPAGSPAAPR